MELLKIFIAFILMLFFCHSQGQSAIIPTGEIASSSEGSVSYSVGQLSIEQNSDDLFSRSEGVQQAYELSIETGYINPNFPIFVTVYPNPAKDRLLVDCAKTEIATLNYQLINTNGVTVLKGSINEQKQMISIYSISEGSYILKLYTTQQIIATFNIIKIQ